jgi:hypothetical protein
MALYITRDRFLERSRLILKNHQKRSKLTKIRRVVKKSRLVEKNQTGQKRGTLVKIKKQAGQKK